MEKLDRMEKVLIIKLGAIGDIVMASTVIPYLKKKYPNIQIHWLGGESMQPLLESIEGIDSLYFIDDRKILNGNFLEKVGVVAKSNLMLGFKKYDGVFSLYRDSRYKMLAFLSATHRLISFEKKGRNQIIGGRYHGSEYMKLVGASEDVTMPLVEYPKLVTSPQNSTALSTVKGFENLIVIAPGGAKNLLQENDIRRYPIKQYVKLANKLITMGYKVCLVGSQQDVWASNHFHGMDVLDLIGKTSMHDVFVVLKKASFFIGHDSGILHLCKLTRTNAIGLFGPVHPNERIPGNSCITPLWGGGDLPCSPCYDGKNFSACENNLCLSGISIDAITGLVAQKKNAI